MSTITKGRSKTAPGVQPQSRTMSKWRPSGAARRTFGCGHRGFGTYCHRCAQAEALEAQVKGGIVIEFKKPGPGLPKVPVERTASKQDIATMTRSAALLRARPGEKVKIVAAPPKADLKEVVDAKTGEPKLYVRPKPTIETLQEKFEKFGAVNAKTLKAKQKAKKSNQKPEPKSRPQESV